VVPAIAATTGAGPAVIGVLVASFPLGMLAGFFLAGQGVRHQRLRTVLLAALTLIALGCLGFVLGQGLAVWFAARLLMGVGSGGLWIAVTFTTLERWPGQEYRCMSRIYAANSAGGLVGPLLGATGGIRGPFLAYLLLVLAAIPLAFLLGPPAQPRQFQADRSALRLPGFWLACAGITVAILTLGLSEGVLPCTSPAGSARRSWRRCTSAPRWWWPPARHWPAAWSPPGRWRPLGCWSWSASAWPGQQPASPSSLWALGWRGRHRAGADRRHRDPARRGGAGADRDRDGAVVPARDRRLPGRPAGGWRGRPGAGVPGGRAGAPCRRHPAARHRPHGSKAGR
jgi:MFS family permease